MTQRRLSNSVIATLRLLFTNLRTYGRRIITLSSGHGSYFSFIKNSFQKKKSVSFRKKR